MGAKSDSAALTETWGSTAPPAGTVLYVGIDIGRHAHRVAAIPEERMANGSWERVVTRTIATGGEGFRELISWVASFHLAADRVRIGCEPTGGWYARTVVAWLERHGYRVDWLQNWAVHEERQLLIGKQAKTDALDARLIARLLYERERWGRERGFLRHAPRGADALRLLVRNRFKLVTLHTRYRLQLTAIEDVLFPEFKEFFRKSTTAPTARLVLEHYPTPADLAAASVDELSHLVLSKAHAVRLGPRLPALHELACGSAGLVDGIDEILASQRWLLRQLRVLDEQLGDIDVRIAHTLESCSSARDRAIVDSLPGMSATRQAVLVAAVGDFSAFQTDRQLRKLLGWYPEALESGSSVSKHRLGQSGNRLARRELWLWAMAVVAPLYPPNAFKSYYRRLRDRGVAGHVAIGHVASKLISVLFYCVRSGRPYDPARHARDLGLG